MDAGGHHPGRMIHNIVSALNWGVAKDEPLHQALKGLAGKRLRIVFPIGGSVDWEIEADGLLKEVGVQTKYSTASTSGISSAPKAPDVTITIQTDLSKGLRIEGDAIVAEKLGPLVKLMKDRVSPWERFWNQSPAGIFAKQVADYAIHESNIVVSRTHAEQHQQLLRQFGDALNRLEKLIDALQR